MAGNTFGEVFKITTFGESHGAAVGVIVDGVTPNVEIDEAYIQKQMDRRKPGQSSVTSPRKEYDVVQIQSGVFEGKTTGTPLFVVLYNKDMKPEAYNDIQHSFRPGHADYTFCRNTEFAIIEAVGGHQVGKQRQEQLAERSLGNCLKEEELRYWPTRKRSEGLSAKPLMKMSLNKMQSAPVMLRQELK